MVDIIFDIETTGLEPLQDRVTAIGVKTYTQEIVFMDKDEAKLLTIFWKYVNSHQYFNLVGYNCWSFDIPFLNIRSLKHRIRVVDVRSKLIDIRYILTNGNRYSKGTLLDFAKLLGFDGKYKNLTGKDAINLWKKEKIDTLKRYVLQDIILTYKIYEECKVAGLIPK